MKPIYENSYYCYYYYYYYYYYKNSSLNQVLYNIKLERGRKEDYFYRAPKAMASSLK